MTAIAVVERAAELAAWEAVPRQVVAFIKAAAPNVEALRRMIKTLKCADPGYGYVFWQPKEKRVWGVLGDGDDQATFNRWHNVLASMPDVAQVEMHAEAHPPDAKQWVLVKRAAQLGAIGAVTQGLGNLLGGPSPLTNSIAGGLLAGGTGYAAGAALEHLFPERYVARGSLRRRLGVLGLGLGALPGVWQGTAVMRNNPELGWKALVTPDQQVPGYEPAASRFAAPLQKLSAIELDSRFEKAADYAAGSLFANRGGAMNVRSIPVDAFNNAIFNDVRRGVYAASRNPYGTKDPWGDNEQELHTPPEAGAAAAGLVAGVGSMLDADSLAPSDLVRGLTYAGIGLSTANVAGRVLGALGMMTPAAQAGLQAAGLWGPLVYGTMKRVFRGN